MKKILSVLALAASSFSASAGTLTITNSTSTHVRMNFVGYVNLSGGGHHPIPCTTSYVINPGTTWSPVTPSGVSIALTGTAAPASVTQLTHFPIDIDFNILGGCANVVIHTPSSPTSMTVTCGAGTYNVSWTVSGPTNDVVVNIS